MDIIFVSIGKTEHFSSFEEVPYKIRGYSSDKSTERALGYCVHREELDNKPEYEGFLGPMWDGGHYRYETPEVYDMLSR